jgi:NitT/TauT family transport system substrate-binding protein
VPFIERKAVTYREAAGMPSRRDFMTMTALAPFGAAASTTQIAAADDVRTVRVLGVPTDGAKSLLYAQSANLFRRRGITADIVPMGSGAAIFAAVLGGSAEFGSGSIWSVFLAYSRGLPLRIIAPASLYLSNHADALLVVRKDSPIGAARDLNGKILGADSTTDLTSTATRAWLDLHGGDGKSLRSVELKQTEQIAALDAGRIDAVVLKPPFLTVALDSGKFRSIGTPLDAVGPHFLLSCWVATADYIAKNPDVVSGFVAGLAEAARYTNAHQAVTTAMVAAFSGQDAAVLARGIRSTTAESLVLSDLQRPLDFAYRNGIIEHHFELGGLLAPTVTLARER